MWCIDMRGAPHSAPKAILQTTGRRNEVGDEPSDYNRIYKGCIRYSCIYIYMCIHIDTDTYICTNMHCGLIFIPDRHFLRRARHLLLLGRWRFRQQSDVRLRFWSAKWTHGFRPWSRLVNSAQRKRPDGDDLRATATKRRARTTHSTTRVHSAVVVVVHFPIRSSSSSTQSQSTAAHTQ